MLSFHPTPKSLAASDGDIMLVSRLTGSSITVPEDQWGQAMIGRLRDAVFSPGQLDGADLYVRGEKIRP